MTSAMLAELEALAALGQTLMLGALAVFARVGAAFALMPAFGERVVPARIRIMLALAMTLVVAPAVQAQVHLPAGGLTAIAGFLASETAIGLALGIGLRLLVMALQIAGTMAAQATSLAQFFGGAGVDPQPAMSQLLVMGGLALLVIAGLPEQVAVFLILSYDLLPAGQWPDAAAMAEWGTARVAHAFSLAFVLAAPFLIGATLYNMALGAINRAMPQLMVAFIGAPAITLGGLVLLMLTASVMLTVWLHAFAGFIEAPGSLQRAP
ncbi:MAG: flagellar biosynthetic protein FliR [Pararhodobacter sp.]